MPQNILASLVYWVKRSFSVLQTLWRKAWTLPVRAYQRTLSFDHGPMKVLYPEGFCPYHPSCSEYTRQAILKYGLILGVLKGSWRILRCNPFTKGGVDHP